MIGGGGGKGCTQPVRELLRPPKGQSVCLASLRATRGPDKTVGKPTNATLSIRPQSGKRCFRPLEEERRRHWNGKGSAKPAPRFALLAE